MTKLQFEGATENINENQFKFLEEVLEKRGFKNTKVVVEDVGIPGDNYTSNVKRIIVEDAAGKPFKMVVKVAPSHEQMRIASNTHNLFINETIMYTEVLPTFKQLQQAAEVPKSDILRFPECYGAHTDAPNELILLEDLKESKFTMLDRFDSLSDNCIKSVLKNFAIFHSLSYALKHKEPQKFENYRHRLFDLWGNLDSSEEKSGYFAHIESHAINTVSDNEKRKTIMKSVGLCHLSATVSKTAKKEVGSKHTVIQQGDSWTNNIMFKFDGEEVQSIMIDYQISKESSPVCDILYMIFNCTDYQSRRKHFYDWIDYYHTELDKALANYGLKANFVYPKDQLDVDLKRYGKLMFSFSVLLANILTMKSNEAAKLKESMESSDKLNVNDLQESLLHSDNIPIFKTRIEGLVDSFVEFGLL